MILARLVIGIISMVLFIFISLQSCVVGLGNAIADNDEVSGSAGFLLALCMLIAGIVAVAGRKSKKASIVAGCIYAFGGLIAIANVGSYGDLIFWSILSFVFAAVFIITAIRQKEDIPTES